MERISCSGVIFVTDKKKILLEDRGRINKHGEEWSFFGGSIEQGETHEQAMKREIKEEMGYEIQNYKYFNKYTFIPSNNPDLELTYYMYIAPAPDIHSLNIHKKAGINEFHPEEALKLKITDIDKKIIRDLIMELN